MKAAFYTLGCKVNQYETEYMAELLQNAGFDIVPSSEEADYYIINSCTVTATADQKTRQSVRRFKRQHPEATVILTGCMPQAFPESATALTQADIVLSNKSNEDILSLINEHRLSHERLIKIVKHQRNDDFQQCRISAFHERVRAFVKIEDGCDRYCSYCIIPMSRGSVRSKTPQDLKEEITELAARGIKEIVLVGINLSSYGKGKEFDIAEAVRICEETEGIQRVRLGSLEPDHITDDIIKRLTHYQKFCPQFHISLQSGCDATLKHMNRHYTAQEFKTLCNKLRASFTDATLTTDVMTGFHEETEEDFNTSLQFVRDIGFEKVHVFPYSQRNGTVASRKGDSVPRAEKERRAKIMIENAQQIRTQFMHQQVGNTVAVLTESRIDKNTYQGYTKNYIPVRFHADEDVTGKELPIVLETYNEADDVCFGNIKTDIA